MSEAIFERLRGEYPPGCMVAATPANGAAFVGGVLSLFAPARAIEVGSNSGVTSAHMADAMRKLGRGSLVCYELSEFHCAASRELLAQVWPGGAWEVVQGDFFSTVRADPVDFAFIDIDPKDTYIAAYKAIVFSDRAVCILHDLDYDPPNINRARAVLIDDGWSVIDLHAERGFVLAVKG